MDFFATDRTGSNGFELFDATHMAWIIGTAVCAVVLCVLYRRMSSTARRTTQRAIGLTLMGIYIIRQIILVILGEYGVGYLPLHLCGMSIYIETIDSMLPNRFTRELCYAVSMPGALMGLLFANWTHLPAFNFIHITSFLFHSIMVVYPLLVIAGGEHRPSLRRLPMCFGFLVAVSVPVYFFNKHFGTNYMFLNKPSPGSPLEWFENWFGNPGYLLGFVIMIAIVWTVMYVPFAVINMNQPAEK